MNLSLLDTSVLGPWSGGHSCSRFTSFFKLSEPITDGSCKESYFIQRKCLKPLGNGICWRIDSSDSPSWVLNQLKG